MFKFIHKKGNFVKKILTALLILIFTFLFTLSVAGAEADYPSLNCSVSEIDKFGNLILSIEPDELKNAGYEYGDVLNVIINEDSYLMPFCTNFTNVDIGSISILDVYGRIYIASTKSDFATNYKIAKKLSKNGKVKWVSLNKLSVNDIPVNITMQEKAGYLEEYLLRQTEISYDRSNYESDEVFANFRNVKIGNFGKNAFFRSSNPVDKSFGRAFYADMLAKLNSIKTVVNLSDSDVEILKYAFYNPDSQYYKQLHKTGKVKPLDLNVDFKSDEFKHGLADGFRFIILNEGPYLIHCTEGKDRTGFVCVLIESLMDASYQEISDDYMQSFVNYYHLKKNTKQYEAIKSGTLPYILSEIAKLDKNTDFSVVDLKIKAEKYLKEIGLTKNEIRALKNRLSKNY